MGLVLAHALVACGFWRYSLRAGAQAGESPLVDPTGEFTRARALHADTAWQSRSAGERL